MQGFYLWVLINILMGIGGFVIAFHAAWKGRNDELSVIPISPADDKDDHRERYKTKSLRLLLLTFSPLIYTLTIFLATLILTPDNTAEMSFIGGLLPAVGISAFFANEGRKYVYPEAMEGINDLGGGDTELYRTYLLLLLLFELPALYGFFYSIVGVNTLVQGTVTDTLAQNYFLGSLILGLSSAGTLIMGKSFQRGPPLFEKKGLLKRKLIKTVLPHIFNVLGLAYAVSFIT